MARPINISSTWTLPLKVFFPIFWCVFFGAMALAFWLMKEPSVGGYSIHFLRILMTSFFLTGAAVLYFSLVQLKRVEVDQDFLYVTNYLKTARYPFHNIEKMEEADYLILKTIRVFFRVPGMFGKSIVFLAHPFRLQQATEQITELKVIRAKKTSST